MKRALRNPDTEMFVKADLGETESIEQARCFDTYQQAFDFCNDKNLKRVELVVRMSDRYEFTVPVLPAYDSTDENQLTLPYETSPA